MTLSYLSILLGWISITIIVGFGTVWRLFKLCVTDCQSVEQIKLFELGSLQTIQLNQSKELIGLINMWRFQLNALIDFSTI